jgi:hypothetical protein
VKYNIIIIVFLNFLKTVWFLLTLYLYNYINTLQVKLSVKESTTINPIDDLLDDFIDRHNEKHNEANK